MLRLLFPYYENRVGGITYCDRDCNGFRDGKYGCGKTVDLVTADIHPFAKIAKDVAAGAVLLFAVIAVIIGAIIFVPYVV